MHTRWISVLCLLVVVGWLGPPAWADTAIQLQQSDNTQTRLGGSGNSANTNLTTLLSCEDQANNLCMTSGGAVRVTQILGTGGVPSTATDATSGTSLIPTGTKAIQGVITCTGTCVQTQKIYGNYANAASNGELLCTLTLSATTYAHDTCPLTNATYLYWYVVTTLTSGTTPLAGVFVQY